tara:strand:- start:4264 stop:5673 length:1410 start_codon:yes stop_codon:yes gene_type:complete
MRQFIWQVILSASRQGSGSTRAAAELALFKSIRKITEYGIDKKGALMIAGPGEKLIARGFSVYFTTGVINKAIPFLLLPLLTRYLSPHEYGMVAIYQALLAFFTPVVGMSANSHIVRNFYGEARERLAEVIFHVLIAISIMAIVVLAIVAVCMPLFGGMFDIPGRWLLVMPLVAFMQTVNKCNLTVYRCEHRSGMYGALEILRTLVNVVVSVGLVVGLGAGWEGRAAGIVTAAILFGGLGFVLMMRSGQIHCTFSLSQLRNIYRISIPMIFYGLGGVIIAVMDRIFIDRMLGKEAVGIYSVGYAFGALTLIITNAFNSSWAPWMQEQLSDVTEKKKRLIVRFTYAYKFAVLLLAIVVTVASHILLPFMTAEAYHGGVQVVLWVALGYSIRGIYSMYFGYVIHVGKTRVFAWVMFLAGAINALANYLLIPVNGIEGAAQATIIAWVFSYLAVWWYASRIYPMPWTRLRRS